MMKIDTQKLSPKTAITGLLFALFVFLLGCVTTQNLANADTKQEGMWQDLMKKVIAETELNPEPERVDFTNPHKVNKQGKFVLLSAIYGMPGLIYADESGFETIKNTTPHGGTFAVEEVKIRRNGKEMSCLTITLFDMWEKKSRATRESVPYKIQYACSAMANLTASSQEVTSK